MATRPRLNDPLLLIGKNYINGEWTESTSGKTFEVTATLITWENGKAKLDAAGEVQFAASFFEWFSEEAVRVYGDVIPHSNTAMRVSVMKEPIGVCGLITPWNFLAAMITRKLGPALVAGCTVVTKTAGETPFTANALFLLGERAGVPKGVINLVCALNNTPEIGATICASSIVRKISFTGSTRVGKLLMQLSSPTLKKLSLELGGNAPFIIFYDADLDLALAGVAASKFKSSGQTCVCANRIFVQSGVYNAFMAKLKEAVDKFKLGHGFEEGTTHGPLVTPSAAQRLAGLVEDALKGGAQLVSGGNARPDLGIKESGMGREGSKYSIEDYLTTKTVVTGNIATTHRSHL
ncbi:unnamed protein product [Clonostachys byssicola]|uniref:Aldehyde dehydrogenase domain-containing protein n=1 Tax=Clonostachys byssicola TaxID=160290 RepID=A0A9N9UNI0_9HYPO|nr:unnamed protein product [Clonostachys byssicola]